MDIQFVWLWPNYFYFLFGIFSAIKYSKYDWFVEGKKTWETKIEMSPKTRWQRSIVLEKIILSR